MKLSELPIGKSATLYRLEDNPLTHKLITMGFLEGRSIRIIRKSLLGSSFYVQVGNHHIALRKEELDFVEVTI